ncbi:MAG: radical SAM protein [Candidatus Helarchaeota archaeon]|nr:radical SAM protein [Candidatus Helarchaeota archaeon]
MQRFEIASVRPPTENFSLAIPAHYYCPWGKCAFCPSVLFTESRTFKRRRLEEILEDISNATLLNELVLESGFPNQSAIHTLIRDYPQLNGCIIHLVYWHLYANASTAFLGGANPLLYKSDFLTKILRVLKSTFPSIIRITSYGRTKSASKKDVQYFEALHQAGLDRIHVGLESGSNQVLKFMNKGVTAEEHVVGGQKIKDGGISLCTYVMPGLGGKKWSTEHAIETARVINEIEPDFVRLRTLEIFPMTSLHGKLRSGEFIELSEEEVVKEERILVENIECNTTITSDSAANLLIEIWGTLPRDKEKIFQAIDNYLSLSPEEKLEFSLKRRVEAFSSQYGGLSRPIERKLNKLKRMQKNDEKYYEKIRRIIKYIRDRLIP